MQFTLCTSTSVDCTQKFATSWARENVEKKWNGEEKPKKKNMKWNVSRRELQVDMLVIIYNWPCIIISTVYFCTYFFPAWALILNHFFLSSKLKSVQTKQSMKVQFVLDGKGKSSIFVSYIVIIYDSNKSFLLRFFFT